MASHVINNIISDQVMDIYLNIKQDFNSCSVAVICLLGP
jgi:hypothetical protein